MEMRAFSRPDITYEDLATFAALPHGLPTEVSEGEYFYFLNIMPPVYVVGGFLICEALTDTPEGKPVHKMYMQRAGKYYGKVVVRGEPATYISASKCLDAYPMNFEDRDHFEKVDDDAVSA